MIETIRDQRAVNSNYHFEMGLKWYDFGKNELLHSPLVYSAFEFRLAIERFTFEFLLLISENNSNFDDINAIKIRKFKNIYSKIYSKYKKKDFEKILIFNHHISKAFTHGKEVIAKINLRQIQKYWERLSEYCHKDLMPTESWENEEWVLNGYNTLHEIKSYFTNLLRNEKLGWVKEDTIKDEILIELKKDFLNGHISEIQLYKRLELVVPVLEHRKGFLNNIIYIPK